MRLLEPLHHIPAGAYFLPAIAKVAVIYPFVYAALNAIICQPYGTLEMMQLSGHQGEAVTISAIFLKTLLQSRDDLGEQ